MNDTKAALIRKQDDQAEQDDRHDFISNLISTIAGYAVLILLALGAVREILFHRNAITPAPVIGPFDFQNFQHVREVIFLPFAIAGRYLINAVRQRYKALPALEDPAVDSFAYDYNIQTKILKINPTDRDGEIRAGSDRDKSLLQRLKERQRAEDIDPAGGSPVNNPPVNNGPVEKEKIIEKDNTIRSCKNCGQDYRIRSFNQKYCSQECKEAYHAQKHDGQSFDPTLYRKSKKRK